MLRFALLTLALTLLTLSPVQAQGTSASEQELFERLVVAEAGGEGVLGQALVARSVLNRVSLLRSRTLGTGTYLARGRTLSGVINGRMQYEPVSSGSINRRRSAAQMSRAREAIALARDTDALRAALRREGRSEAQINNLLRATGFRTRGAYNDPSQNFDRTTFGNHVFNTDRFSRREDVIGTFDRYYRQGRAQTRRELSAPASRGRGGQPEESEAQAADTSGLAGAVRGTTASGRAEAEANAAGQGAAPRSSAPAAPASQGQGDLSPAARDALDTERDLQERGELQAEPSKAELKAAELEAAERAAAERAAAERAAAERAAETPAEAWQRGLQESEDAWLNGVSPSEIPVAEPVEPLAPAPYDDEVPSAPAGKDQASASAGPSAPARGRGSPSGADAPSAPPAASGAQTQSPLAQAATELLTAVVRRALGAEERGGPEAASPSEGGAPAPASSAPSAPAASAPSADAPAKSAEASEGQADAPGAAGAVAPPEAETATPEAASPEAANPEASEAPSDADRRAYARFLQRFGPLRLGAQGPMVKRLQAKITARQTGFFGMATQENLQAWQRSRGLAPSGEVDFATFLALRSPQARRGRRAVTPRVNRSRRAQREAGRSAEK